MAKALRNCWCTPKWLAELIGRVQLDPCSNERSHIDAKMHLILGDGVDGLGGPPGVFINHGISFATMSTLQVFINPPYANGQVIKWVRQYCHTRFIYLLRWDPSTAWFSELLPHCTHVWFPPSRVDFEPPPRIRESSNPYPHALYLRDPPADLLERLSANGYLFVVPKTHGHQEVSTASSECGGKSGGERDAGGSTAGSGGNRDGDAVGPRWTVPARARR